MSEPKPPADDSFAHANPTHDLTGRVREAVRSETSGPLAQLVTRLKNLRWLVSAAITLLLLGGAGVVWIGTFARASDVDQLSTKIDATNGQVAAQAKKLDEHIAAQTERDRARDQQSALIQHQLDRADEHMEWQDRQLLEVAKATPGARVLTPPPKHRPPKSEEP